MAALPHPDRRRFAHRPAARQQHRPHRGRGARRRPRRHELAAHQRPGRGARAAERGRGEIALRTQQVIMEETGVINVADPLGGSWYVEALTDQMEAEAEAIFDRISELSPDGSMTCGILRGIEDGWFTSEIAEAPSPTSSRWRRATRRSSASTATPARSPKQLEILRVSTEVEREQRSARRPPRRARPARGRFGPGGADRGGEDRRRTWSRRCWTRPGPRPRSARSAASCATTGVPTRSPPRSDFRVGRLAAGRRFQAGLATGSPASFAAASRSLS